jgi:DNA-binding transcriptional regulator GbsR (MarR family)
MSNRFQQFLEQTNDLMARKFELDLFSPLSGRIFGLLLFAPEPVSLQEIADTIGVSKAAVSVQARILENIGLCRKMRKANDRKDYYMIVEHFSDKVLQLALEKNKRWLAEMEQIMQDFPPRSEVAEKDFPAYESGKKRLEEMMALYRLLWNKFSDLIEEWNEMKKRLQKF